MTTGDDVMALFTSVPIAKALVIIRDRLERDEMLKDQTSLQPPDVMRLLELYLKCTYFMFLGEFYQQIVGASMGSLVSPITCNLYMEHLEERAMAETLHRP